MKFPLQFVERPNLIGLLCLALPFLVLGGLTAYHALNLQNHTEYRLKIEGYDPRDLLRGHYIILESLLRGNTAQFEVGLVAYPNGTGQLKNLYINGEKLEDFLRSKS
jgi:hypothetical protein